ncbi:hypothetical protein ACWDR3_33705 [Streptomyces sp. NPDC001002]
MRERDIPDIEVAVAERRHPTITLWNRLETRPRKPDFQRALRAEIRDPLWMLSRQWQLGEFQAEDAGSPVRAEILVGSSPLEQYRAGVAPASPLEADLPLEARVERRPVPFARAEQRIALDLRLAMGRRWLKFATTIADLDDAYIDRYGVETPDPLIEASAGIVAHRAVWQAVSAVAGRAMDGFRLYEHLRADPPGHASDGIAGVPPGRGDDLDALGDRFVSWFEKLITQPPGDQDAWRPDALEYRFSVTAADGEALNAYAYHQGHLDWYALDVGDTSSPVAPATEPLRAVLPAPVTFEGMPASRWWTFEDSRINLGDLQPGTIDLAKLLLIDFALVHGNDWFLFPLPLATNTSTRIRGLTVTDVFGERTWLDAAGQGVEQDWQRWSMFSLTDPASTTADTRFVLLGTSDRVQEGKPLEEVLLTRDEMANMVWGIETRTSLPDGSSVPGQEAALERHGFHERLAAQNPLPVPDSTAPVRYQVMSEDVLENWIPLVPVHVPDNNREIQLQRAALPRTVEGRPGQPERVRPLTALLREGLDARLPYFIHEEEVPRAGVRVTQSYQRTRWYGGRTVVWLGVRKLPGGGESTSNLAFDQLRTSPRADA